MIELIIFVFKEFNSRDKGITRDASLSESRCNFFQYDFMDGWILLGSSDKQEQGVYRAVGLKSKTF